MAENLCPSTDELNRLLAGNTSGIDDNVRVLGHLESCTACQRRLDDLAGNDLTDHSSDDIQTAYSRYRWSNPSALESENRQEQSKALVSRFLLDVGVRKEGDFNPDIDPYGRIGNVELLELLGRGGMGMVFKGRDTILDRAVAVKIIDPRLSSDELVRQRFLQEARLAASIDHPNVVKIHSVDDSLATPALIMELVGGSSLNSWPGEKAHREENSIRKIARQVAEGLSAAHAKKIIHRDIKPGNLLLENATGKIKIADFGLAFATERSGCMTSDGVVLGTPEYMSPEQVSGKPLDARSDLFSLGAVLYELCTGERPFAGHTVMSIAYQVTHELHQPVRRLNPEISKDFADIVDRLLNKSVEDRFQSADELIEALDGNGHRTGFPMWQTGITAAALVLVSLAIYAGTQFDWQKNQNQLDAPTTAKDETDRRIRIVGRTSQFASLTTAIDAAQPGDEIVLQGGGLFALDRREINCRSLTIRSDNQRARVLLEEPQDSENSISLTGELVLKNIELEIRSQNAARENRRQSAIAISDSGKLKMERCRILSTGFIGAILMDGGTLELKDSSLFAPEGVGISSTCRGRNEVVVENGLLVGRSPIVWIVESRSDLGDEKITLTNSTVRSGTFFKLQQESRGQRNSTAASPLAIRAEQTVFSNDTFFELRGRPRAASGTNRAFSEFVRGCVGWSGQKNLYRKGTRFFVSNANPVDVDPQELDEWTEFWGDREKSSSERPLDFSGPKESALEKDHLLIIEEPDKSNFGNIGFRLTSEAK